MIARRPPARGLSASLAALLALACVPGVARAQDDKDKKNEPPPDNGAVSVPAGAAGAILKPGDKPPPPAPGQPTMPRALNYAPPAYPPDAEKQGLEGEVVLEIDVDRDGAVTRAVVKTGAGHGFDESALAAAKKLKFDPARRPDGTPFSARIQYRYTFALKKAPEPPPGQGQSQKPEAKKTSSLRGVVVLAEGDVAIAGAVATLSGGASMSVKTDEQGAFRFDDLPNGSYRVTLAAPGYEGASLEEDFPEPEQREVKYRLVPKDSLEVVVRGKKPPREVTKRTLEQREISRIPGTNGDALRSIQSLPGVARPPGLAGLLIVRGSAPQDTQTYVDGTNVPLIYHFGGLSSVIPTEMLEKIDFYPGNFSTQFGRVQGGVVDVGIRSPKDDGKYHGMAQLDLIDARLMVEGPVPFLKGVNFEAAGRRSWVDAWLGPVLKAAGAGVTQAPVYYDYQLVVEGNPSPSTNARVAFFGSDDALKLLLDKPSAGEPALSGSVGLHTGFERLQGRIRTDLKDGDSLNFVAALGNDNIDFGLSSLFFNLAVRTLTGRLEYTKKIAKGVEANMGLDVLSGHYDVNARLPAPPIPGQPPNQPFSTRTVQNVKTSGTFLYPGAYFELALAPTSRWRIVPGVRFDRYSITNDTDISPRINARYVLVDESPKTTLKGGVGFFHQPPQFQEATQPLGSLNMHSNRAIHYGLGVEQELNRHVEASLEGFYKQLDQSVVAQATTSGTYVSYANTGHGQVVGLEVLLKYKPDDRFFGWLAYTLSRSTRVDGPGQDERLVPYDQTHILTILGSYRLGYGWEFGARFRLVSGNLITPNVCDPTSPDCDPLRTGGLFHAPSGTYTPIPFSGAYTERLPLFHQLDIRLDKRWKFKSWQLSWYLDIQNVYNHQNVEAIGYNYNYTTRQNVPGLPFLPSLGLRGDF